MSRWANRRGNTTARGYGASHQALRRVLLPKALGTPCTRCGKPMLAGQQLDLDHTDDRRGYRGFSHSKCNRKAGGKKAHEVRDPKTRSVTRW